MKRKQYEDDIIDHLFFLTVWIIPKFILYNIPVTIFRVIRYLINKSKAKDNKQLKSFSMGKTEAYSNQTLNPNKDIVLSEYDLQRHFLILGGTGSGKSNLLTSYIDYIIKKDKYQFFILDPKGQTVCDVLENTEIKDYVYYDLSDNNSFLGYNPLLLFKTDKKSIDKCLSDIKTKIIPNITELKDTQVHANIFLKRILEFHKAYYEKLVILYGREKANNIIIEKQLTITDIARLVESKDYRLRFQDLLLKTFVDYDDSIYNYFDQEFLDDKGRLTQELERLCIHLSKECLNNEYETFLESKGLNPLNDLQDGKSVLINFNGTHKQVTTGMISLFFKEVYKHFKDQNKNNQRGSKKELIIIIEEAHAIKLQKEELDEIIRMGRSLGIYLILVNQDIDGFDKEVKSVIEEVIQTQISFNRGRKHSKDVLDNLNPGECIFYSPTYKRDSDNNPYKVKTMLFTPNKIKNIIISKDGQSPSKVFNSIKSKEIDIVKHFY